MGSGTKPTGGAAELATVRLESGNERLVFLECPPENLPPVLPHAVLKNDSICNVLKVGPVVLKFDKGIPTLLSLGRTVSRLDEMYLYMRSMKQVFALKLRPAPSHQPPRGFLPAR